METTSIRLFIAFAQNDEQTAYLTYLNGERVAYNSSFAAAQDTVWDTINTRTMLDDVTRSSLSFIPQYRDSIDEAMELPVGWVVGVAA